MRYRLLRFLEKVKSRIPSVLLEESGQDLVEYSLLVLLIGTGLIAAVDRFGDVVYYSYQKISYLVGHAGQNFNH